MSGAIMPILIVDDEATTTALVGAWFRTWADGPDVFVALKGGSDDRLPSVTKLTGAGSEPLAVEPAS